MVTVEQYLRDEMAEGKIDFTFRAVVDGQGHVMIYIHPLSQTGQTTPLLRVNGNLVSEPLSAQEMIPGIYVADVSSSVFKAPTQGQES